MYAYNAHTKEVGQQATEQTRETYACCIAIRMHTRCIYIHNGDVIFAYDATNIVESREKMAQMTSTKKRNGETQPKRQGKGRKDRYSEPKETTRQKDTGR